MSYCSPQELMTYLQGDTYRGSSLPWLEANAQLQLEGKPTAEIDRYHGRPVEYNPALVEAVLKVVHENVAKGVFLPWKEMRPWVITDVTASLPKDRPWIGWEIETGWLTQKARQDAITGWQDKYKYTCTDNEGHGPYPVEITLAPQTPEYWNSRGTPVHPLLYVCSLADRAEVHNANSMVGTHVNFSTPAFRTTRFTARVENTLNLSVSKLKSEEKLEFFGRSRLYAGFFLRGGSADESMDGASTWIEGKLFNSTYSPAVARGYIKVAERLAHVMEEVSKYYDGGGKSAFVNNFADVLRGTTDELDMKESSEWRDGDDVSYDDDYDDDDDYTVEDSESGTYWCDMCQEYHHD